MSGGLLWILTCFCVTKSASKNETEENEKRISKSLNNYSINMKKLAIANATFAGILLFVTLIFQML